MPYNPESGRDVEQNAAIRKRIYSEIAFTSHRPSVQYRFLSKEEGREGGIGFKWANF